MKTNSENYTLRYIVRTYLIFWAMILGIGGAASALGATPFMMKWVVFVCSWAPTYALLPMIKKIYPGTTIREFYKRAFSQRINIPLTVLVTAVILSIFIISTVLNSKINGIDFTGLFDLSIPTLISGLFFSIIQGATGEESGWRGFLQPNFENKYGVVKGSAFVGIIWAIFHMPLWFITSGYTGLELVKYIVVFCISIISFSVITGIVYNKCRNLFLPIWMHFVFNFSTACFTGKRIDILTWFALLYTLAAIGFVIFYILSHKKDITAVTLCE